LRTTGFSIKLKLNLNLEFLFLFLANSFNIIRRFKTLLLNNNKNFDVKADDRSLNINKYLNR